MMITSQDLALLVMVTESVSRRGVLVGIGALGIVGALGVTARGAQEQEAAAGLRLLHASPDAPAVDVLVDDEVVLSGAGFGSFAGYDEYAAGEHTVQVVPAGGDPADAVVDATVSLEADVDHTLAVFGLLEDIDATLLTDDTESAPEDGSLVRAVHLSPDAPNVDVAVEGGEPVISDLAYPSASPYVTGPVGAATLELRPAGSTDAVLSAAVELAAGESYSVYALGLVDGTEEQSLRVLALQDGVVEMPEMPDGNETATPDDGNETMTPDDGNETAA